MNTPLVSVSWLNDHFYDQKLIILDATISKVTCVNEQLETKQIKGARFFDIKYKFSDVSARFPNTLPTLEQFNKEAQNLGVCKDSVLIVYDDYGFYSSARAWWLFKAFGHHQVAILDGGLPEWKKNGFPLEEKHESNYQKGDFSGKINPEMFKFFNDIKVLKNAKDTIILDARSKERFDGLLPEPRKELRSGNIPNSKNLPYQELLSGNVMKSSSELKNIFHRLNPQNKKMVFSCGSGITACILALGAELSGYKNLSVYDGSWTEYGTLTT